MKAMITEQLADSPIVYYKETASNGDWALFLHAAFVTHEMFCEQIKALRTTYRILTLDIIGHGASTKTGRKDRLGHMSRWIKEILDKESIDRIHVVGVSLGAVLAQDFANHYPQRVLSLACFGGYDINRFDPKLQKENGLKQMGMMMKAIFSVSWFAKANRHISAYTPQAQEAFYKMNLSFPKSSFRYLASISRMVNVFPPHKRTYPLLIGCGEHDIPTEITAVKMWKQDEPEAYMVILKDAGHCVNMDVPQAFHQLMHQFWQSAS